MSSVIKAHRVIYADVEAPITEQPEPPSGPAPQDPRVVRPLARLWLNYAPLMRGAQVRAEAIVTQARDDADAIVQDAEARRAEIVEAARTEGFQSGEEAGKTAGREQALAELAQQRRTLERVVEEAHQLRTELVQQYRADIVELAIGVAAKLLRRTDGLNEETAAQLLAEMLPRTVGVRQVVVKLHPDDLAALEQALDGFANHVAPGTTVRFTADQGLKRGDVMVETERGGLDGTGSVRTRRLVSQLLDVMDNET